MITGMLRQQRTEQQYRQVELDSSSSLKCFLDSPIKYFKEYIVGEKKREEDDRSKVVGSICHCLLLEDQEAFNRKFYMTTVENRPSGYMLEFVNALYRFTEMNCSENGEVLVSFDYLLEQAYRESGYKISKQQVINKFVDGSKGPSAESYYNQLREVRRRGLIVATEDEMSSGEKIAEELRRNEFTGPIFNQEDNERYRVYKEMQVEGFEIDGLKMKGMLDHVLVDHVNKTVQPTDLKVTWSVRNFFNEYYLQRKAYLQAYVYQKATEAVLSEIAGPDYKVLPIQFVAADSIGLYHPLIYRLTQSDLDDAYYGFEVRGWRYPGVQEVIENLLWAKENENFRISKFAYEHHGIVPLQFRA